MTIRTRGELDEALLRVFVEALADEPLDASGAADTSDAIRDPSARPGEESPGPDDSALKTAA